MAINLGIIGFGGMAGWHTKNCCKVPGVKAVAAYDIDPVRVDAAREAGLRGYNNLTDFLADKEINVVLVATPNDVHPEMVIAALNAGKHAISEKPVAMSVQELDAMIAASQKNGKLFTVHQNRRWDKDYCTVKKVIKDGMLGRIVSVQSRLHGSGGVMHGWRGVKAKGGGMLYDWGVHFIDQLYDLFGYEAFVNVRCMLSSVKNPEIDDYFILLFQLKDGTNIQVEIGTYVLKELPRWFVIGDEATCFINNFQAEGNIVRVNSLQEDKPILIMTSAGPTRTFAPRPDSVKDILPLPEVAPAWTDFYTNVNDAIDGKAELIVKPWQVRKVLATMEACFQSAATGQVVDLTNL